VRWRESSCHLHRQRGGLGIQLAAGSQSTLPQPATFEFHPWEFRELGVVTPFITRSDNNTVLISACDFQMSTLLKAMRLPLQRHAVNASGFGTVKVLRPCLPSFADCIRRGLRLVTLVVCVLAVLSLDRAVAGEAAGHEIAPAQVPVAAAPGLIDRNFALSPIVPSAAALGFARLSAEFQTSDEDQAGDESNDAELELVWMEDPEVELQTVEPLTNQARSFRLPKTKTPP